MCARIALRGFVTSEFIRQQINQQQSTELIKRQVEHTHTYSATERASTPPASLAGVKSTPASHSSGKVSTRMIVAGSYRRTVGFRQNKHVTAAARVAWRRCTLALFVRYESRHIEKEPHARRMLGRALTNDVPSCFLRFVFLSVFGCRSFAPDRNFSL